MEEKAKQHFDLSEKRVIDELMKVGFANVQDFMKYTETGEVTFIPSHELTRDQLAAVSEIKNSKKFDTGGKHIGTDVNIKMNDKLKALEMLGRKMGMFNDKLNVTKKVINVTLDEDDQDEPGKE